MAVPAAVTAGIATLNGLTAPNWYPNDNAQSLAASNIKAYMLANGGAYPSDAVTRIQTAILAGSVGVVEAALRQQILADFLAIQALG